MTNPARAIDDALTLSGSAALRDLPLGSVRPEGWLLEQLRLQAEGLTGALEEIWPDVGPDSAWLGGDGEDWERGPYYLDGLIPLAHVLRDDALLAKASRWVEAILARQRADGQFGPETNEDWWPRMVVLKALVQHAEATGDERVAPFLSHYFRFQRDHLPARPLEGWGQARAAENVLCVLWLYERAPEAWLLELAELLLDQSTKWGPELAALRQTTPAQHFEHLTHVVNVAMGLKHPAVHYRLDGDAGHRERVFAALEQLDRHHGQVTGVFSGDEWLAGIEPHHGVELCAVVELMFSLEQLLGTFGEGAFADRLESVAYNALAAAMSADVTAHQYHQQPNQVLCTIADRDWTFAGPDANLFGLEPNFGCCTANLHQGWPKLARSLWMATPDDGLAAVVYAPSRVSTEIGGERVELATETAYPFEEQVRITVSLDAPLAFPLLLRIPGWCEDATLHVRGEPLGVGQDERGFVRIDRRWQTGDVVELRLPMRPRLLRRPTGAVGVAVGPLVMAHSPGEIWTRVPGSIHFGDWEVRFRDTWNVALVLDPQRNLTDAPVERLGPASPPFGIRSSSPGRPPEAVPLRVQIPARRLPDWRIERGSAPPPPPSPVTSSRPSHGVSLVPYGCARTRIAEFPWCRPDESPSG